MDQSDNDELAVFICVPNYCTRAVKIKKNDPCGKLQTYFQQQMDLVYNGQLLDNQSTFASYNINLWDPIIAVTKGQSNEERQNWLNVTTDSEYFNQSIQNVMNTRHRCNVLRRIDISSSRLEMHPKLYRRMVAQYQEANNKEVDRAVTPTVIPEVGQMGCDPLPTLW